LTCIQDDVIIKPILPITEVKRGVESSGRAGTTALTLLATPINVHVLRSLAEESMSLMDLRRAAGSPPQTTMRGHMRTLTETGALTRRRQNEFPGALDFELTAIGRELWEVAEVVQSWLSAGPEGPIELGTTLAKNAIKALAAGWSSNMVRALAARPLSLTELNALISSLNYPSLERRLAAMRLVGLIKRQPGKGRGTPYIVTDWLRRAIAPLAAAARWERENAAPETVPIRRLDAEAGLLLTVPFVRLDAGVTGSCRLAVDTGTGSEQRLAGVTVEVERGKVASCVARLEGAQNAWAIGPPSAWIAAVIDREPDRLELGGDEDLSRGLIDGMHRGLFRNGS
jgi:DNA-binding HxlR family transcriptional regulator